MDLDTEIIIYMILDLLAKGVFGAILVGARECLEGDFTPLAMMVQGARARLPRARRSAPQAHTPPPPPPAQAMAMTGISPNMRRRNSVDMTFMEEARFGAKSPQKRLPQARAAASHEPHSDGEETGNEDVDESPGAATPSRSLKVREVRPAVAHTVVSNPLPTPGSDELTAARAWRGAAGGARRTGTARPVTPPPPLPLSPRSPRGARVARNRGQARGRHLAARGAPPRAEPGGQPRAVAVGGAPAGAPHVADAGAAAAVWRAAVEHHRGRVQLRRARA